MWKWEIDRNGERDKEKGDGRPEEREVDGVEVERKGGRIMKEESDKETGGGEREIQEEESRKRREIIEGRIGERKE